MLKEKLRELATLRQMTLWTQNDVEMAYDAVRQTNLYQDYEEANERVKGLQEQMKELISEINDLTLDAYKKTGNKSPAPGVGIRVYQKMNYEKDAALEWAMANKMPALLKIDSRQFEKYAKGVKDVMPLEFVEYYEEPRPTISSDLSAYLAEA